MAVTIHEQRPLGYKEFMGLSTDDKPTEDVAVNSLFLELDTGDFYFCKTQGSKGGEQTEVVRIEEQTFITQGFSRDYGCRYATLTVVEPFADENIIVIYDGVSYECQNQSFESGFGQYGAEIDDYVIDFTKCPFHLQTNDESNTPIIYLTDEEEHTIEVRAIQGNPDTPAVWEKVGSGGSEPTGTKLFEGNVTTANYGGDIYYEFDPVLALNYSSLIVEFEGTKYTVSKLSNEYGVFEFGDSLMNWSEYPFNLYYNKNDELQSLVSTESAGTYSLKIWANSEPIDTEPLIPVGGDMNS